MGLVAKFRVYRDKFKAARPEYTKRQFFFKAGMLLVSAIGLDMYGQKIASLDFAYQNGQLTAAQAHGLTYALACGIQGVFMGLALWRLLELYWWAKNQVNDCSVV